MKKKMIKLFTCLFVLSGCSLTIESSSSINSDSSSMNSIESNSNSQNQEADLSYLDLFDIHNVVRFEIHMSDEQLQKLNSDYENYHNKGLKSPIYRKADQLKIQIIKENKEYNFSFNDVGVRMKGNTSRRTFINDKNEIYSKIHLKLSFEETFDDPTFYTAEERISWTEQDRLIRENRDFLGLSKLDIRYNKNEDQSYIKEHYALEMYRDYGILSQHSSFASLSIVHGSQNTHFGTVLITEPLTKKFIKHSLENGQYFNMGSWNQEKNGSFGVEGSNYGQLYKASYGIGRVIAAPNMTSYESRLFGVEASDGTSCPPYELKTNKDSNDHSQIKALFKALNEKDVNEIAKLMDIDYFLTYEAIATFLGDPDDLRNNYNNYALYFRKTDGKMVLIPIDQDRVLGVAKDYDPAGDAMSNVSPLSTKAEGAKQIQLNPLYKKVLLNNETNKNIYLNKLKELFDSKWATEDHFNQIHNLVKSHYENTKDDLQKVKWSLEENYYGPDANMSFKEYISRKKNTITAKPDDSTEDSDNIIQNIKTFYLTGTMDNWNKTTKEYLFTALDETTYQYQYQIQPGHMECKVYTPENGGMWLRAENNKVLHEHGNNITFDFTQDQNGKILTFKIDTKTGKLSWEIN